MKMATHREYNAAVKITGGEKGRAKYDSKGGSKSSRVPQGVAELNKSGLKMYGVDGSYVLMNNTVGFSGYDRNDNPIYWVNGDEFHQKKSVIEEEITLCSKMRFIPIEIYNGNTLVNDGIGLVSTVGGGS